MPDWILWVMAGWIVWAVVGRHRAGQGRCGQRALRSGRCQPHRRVELAGPEAAQLPPRRPTTEALEERLRARYVAGELGLEEYERELDRLYRRA